MNLAFWTAVANTSLLCITSQSTGWLCDDDGWSGGNGLASKLRGNQEKTGALEFSVEVGGPCGKLFVLYFDVFVKPKPYFS